MLEIIGMRDGTCIRDYLHIMDLAEGHVAAYECLKKRIKCFELKYWYWNWNLCIRAN